MQQLITLSNKFGMEVDILTYGARVVSIRYPTAISSVELLATYSEINDFYQDTAYMGATCGRVCNRIGGGGFNLDGQFYPLKNNDGNYCLHGGENNFALRQWEVLSVTQNSITLRLLSLSGDQGFPGEVDVCVTYTLDDNHRLAIDYHATTTQATPLNLTNHCYFNLGEDDCRSLLLTLHATHYLESNPQHAPTGRILPVANSGFDFTCPQSIADQETRVFGKDKGFGEGFDHCYVLNQASLSSLAASLYSKQTGVCMDIYTDQPGLQLYTGAFLDDVFVPQQGLCLEAQGFPDAVNYPHFESVIVQPQQPYQKSIQLHFSQSHR